MGLTAKQEAFVLNILQGMSHADAYRNAGYSVDNMLPATIYNNAYMLTRDSDVKARLMELKAEQEANDPRILSIAERKRILSEIAQAQGDEKPRSRDRIAAIDIHNKMDRVYADVPQAQTQALQINVMVKGEGKNLTDWLLAGGVGDEAVDGKVE